MVQKFCEHIESHVDIYFCDKKFVIVCGEPTPTADHLKFLLAKFFSLDASSQNSQNYCAVKIWSYTIMIVSVLLTSKLSFSSILLKFPFRFLTTNGLVLADVVAKYQAWQACFCVVSNVLTNNELLCILFVLL